MSPQPTEPTSLYLCVVVIFVWFTYIYTAPNPHTGRPARARYLVITVWVLMLGIFTLLAIEEPSGHNIGLLLLVFVPTGLTWALAMFKPLVESWRSNTGLDSSPLRQVAARLWRVKSLLLTLAMLAAITGIGDTPAERASLTVNMSVFAVLLGGLAYLGTRAAQGLGVWSQMERLGVPVRLRVLAITPLSIASAVLVLQAPAIGRWLESVSVPDWLHLDYLMLCAVMLVLSTTAALFAKAWRSVRDHPHDDQAIAIEKAKWHTEFAVLGMLSVAATLPAAFSLSWTPTLILTLVVAILVTDFRWSLTTLVRARPRPD